MMLTPSEIRLCFGIKLKSARSLLSGMRLDFWQKKKQRRVSVSVDLTFIVALQLWMWVTALNHLSQSPTEAHSSFTADTLLMTHWTMHRWCVGQLRPWIWTWSCCVYVLTVVTTASYCLEHLGGSFSLVKYKNWMTPCLVYELPTPLSVLFDYWFTCCWLVVVPRCRWLSLFIYISTPGWLLHMCTLQ